jgi:hypothetical protein
VTRPTGRSGLVDDDECVLLSGGLPLIANSYQIPVVNELTTRSTTVRSYNDDLEVQNMVRVFPHGISFFGCHNVWRGLRPVTTYTPILCSYNGSA